MRSRSLLTAVLILAGAPLLAQSAHQSYITYDDSDSVLVQNDGKEIDARVNLPVYPGDEIRAAKRGRTELRLADGNIVALDRDSAVRFESMLLNFEEGGQQTVVQLLEGQVLVYRRYEGSEPLRLDTPNASFVAERESIYGVETNSRGVDVATVFEGSVEVRTPKGTDLLRAGERVKIDVTGVYDRRAISSSAGTEFERWFLSRAERYANKESRHLDASLAYAEDDLNDNGRWVYVKDYDTWAWSPYVSSGWRPYYYGYWGWGAGGACWISYEPWGWVPYHYGSWSYVSHYGWIWFPGQVYAPAWVYWAWGPTWVGWVPWGYYTYYPGYYPWLYDPYCDPYVYGHYGFRGSVTVSSGDLSAYTVVDSRTLFSNRVDRAALTADAVRDRLTRDGGSATFTNQSPRINRADMRDPSTTVDRIVRGGRDGSGTGSVGAGSSGDLTQFFQRDPALPQDVKNRVTRGRDQQQSTRGTTSRPGSTLPSAGGTSSSPTSASTLPRGGRGGGGSIDRGGSTGSPTTTGSTTSTGGATVNPRGGSGTATLPRAGGSSGGGSTGGATTGTPSTNRPRGVVPSSPRTQETDSSGDEKPRGGDGATVDRPTGGNSPSASGDWRTRPSTRGGTVISSSGSGTGTTGGTGASASSRPRIVTRGTSGDPVSRPSTTAGSSSGSSVRGGTSGESWRGSGDTVRRVIGSIGGARLSPSSGSGSSSSGSGGRSGSSGSVRGGSSSGSSSSGRGSSGGSSSVSRPSSGGSSSSSPSSGGGSSSSPRSGGGGSSSSSGGGSSSSPRSGGGGGTIHRGGS